MVHTSAPYHLLHTGQSLLPVAVLPCLLSWTCPLSLTCPVLWPSLALPCWWVVCLRDSVSWSFLFWLVSFGCSFGLCTVGWSLLLPHRSSCSLWVTHSRTHTRAHAHTHKCVIII